MASLHRDQVAAIVVLLLIVGGWIHADSFPPRAAMFPKVVFAVSTVVTVVWLVRSSLRRPAVEGPLVSNWGRFLIFLGLCALFALLVDFIGFFTATTLFVGGASLALGYRRYRYLAGYLVGFIALLVVVFVVIFNRPLPPEFFQ